MSWTPVSQGYPKKLFECLVTVFQPQRDEDNEDTFVTEARYLHDNKWDFYYNEYYQYDTSQWAVTAWMEKPKLPKPYNDFKEELTMYGDPKLYKEAYEKSLFMNKDEIIEALHEIIKAYGEDEGYIPERVADFYNKYHVPWELDSEQLNKKINTL